MDNKDRQVKQVIVVRKDLNMSIGKTAAQVSHASLGALLKLFKKTDIWEEDTFPSVGTHMEVNFEHNSFLDKWLNGIFTKICLGTKNEASLLKLYNKIEKEKPNIPIVLIEDCGLTEFNGVPTKTCIGIGPYWSDEIDEFTKKLQLL